jgi:hypothetical protein
MLSTPRYHHRQFGAVLVGSLAASALVLVGLGLALGDRVFVFGGPVMMGVVALLFYDLTVEIDATYLTFRFGVGLIRKLPRLAAIQAEGWTVDPLGGEVTQDNRYGKSAYDRGGGYVWGRGVNDDKGEMVSLIFALQAIRDLNIPLEGDLIITGNCDEETGNHRPGLSRKESSRLISAPVDGA